MSDLIVASGTTVNLTNNSFIKAGWTFCMWNTSADGSGTDFADGASYPVGTADVILYAVWSPPQVYSHRDIGPAGGWVFYVKSSYSDGWRYLEAAPTDRTSHPWGTYGLILPGADGSAIGTGLQNTLDIVRYDPLDDTAADDCANYCIVSNGVVYDDWFLPSYDELVAMYLNLKSKGIGDFSNRFYWSSTETHSQGARTFSFRHGDSDQYAKSGTVIYHRAARYF